MNEAADDKSEERIARLAERASDARLQVHSGGHIFFLELLAVGDRIICTPTVSGWMVPFHLRVTVGQPVTITWDHEISRYLVTTAGQWLAA